MLTASAGAARTQSGIRTAKSAAPLRAALFCIGAAPEVRGSGTARQKGMNFFFYKLVYMTFFIYLCTAKATA